MKRRPTIFRVRPTHGNGAPATRTRLVREAGAKEWLAANRKAIDAYNARVERDGAWSDKLRGF